MKKGIKQKKNHRPVAINSKKKRRDGTNNANQPSGWGENTGGSKASLFVLEKATSQTKVRPDGQAG